MSAQRNLILGAGMAGVSAAESMRQAGFDGEIRMIGDEPELPYHRPPLSKHFLGPEQIPPAELAIHPTSFFREQRIELELGRGVQGIDFRTRRATLAGGASLYFNRALIATGARPRRLAVPRSNLDGVVHLRTLADGTQLAARIARAEHVVVIGAGLIGLEVASAARALGKRVTVLEAGTSPLQRVLDARMGAVVADLHRESGVDLRLATSVTALHGGPAVSEVETAQGQRLAADLVVVAIGVEPAVESLIGSGILLDEGVLVDEYTNTSIPGVHAAGDVARAWNPLLQKRVRLEQVGNARAQGQAAGRAMAGRPEVYAPLPAVATRQHRHHINVLGVPTADADLIVRGQRDEWTFIGFYVEDARVVAVVAFNRTRDLRLLKSLVRSRARVHTSMLEDDEIALERVA